VTDIEDMSGMCVPFWKRRRLE